MENIETLNPISEEEIIERQFKQAERDLRIKKTRAFVLRNQITDAYTILENIRFDYLGDTAFRGKITTAKRGLERAMTDFLLSDSYWEESIEKHRKMTPKEYDKYMKTPISPSQGEGK